MDVNAVVAVFDRFLSSEASASIKATFAQRKLEFLEDFGQDIVRYSKMGRLWGYFTIPYFATVKVHKLLWNTYICSSSEYVFNYHSTLCRGIIKSDTCSEEEHIYKF
jgi:hypothetical protein